MKHIKTYEELKSEPKVGDYVVCRFENEGFRNFYKSLSEFCEKTVGQLVEIKKTKSPENAIMPIIYYIHFGDFPMNLRASYKNPFGVAPEDIEFYSENKEECEAFIAAKKYNL